MGCWSSGDGRLFAELLKRFKLRHGRERERRNKAGFKIFKSTMLLPVPNVQQIAG